ncbi:MAG: protein kinase [Candidatus Eremiobacteraeota bacterium]|nr:protein kinase [Candidatus Eremiobacteraeota bacterium]
MTLIAGLESWRPGTVLDGLYEVKGIIGIGGMGAVVRVGHLEWNLDMAVKVPLPQMMKNPVHREGFLREAQTWIDLGAHPNIVQCWYVREYLGVPALFLDYLTGGSLKDWIDQGYVRPGEWAKILDLIIQSADGLTHAHRYGVIHRDVKPANLLVRGDDRVCVTDFGIVKTVTSAEAGAKLEGALLGTPDYGAPEQWITGATIGPAIDIYALGVVLFELCVGRIPFQTEKPQDGIGMIQHHWNTPVPAPRSLREDVPGPLNDLILACLSKQPEGRPPTAQALREELTNVYRQITGADYPRPEPVEGVQRADSLNNRAVSLYNLNKTEEALESWNEAANLDGQHHETVFNRSLLEWRRSKLTADEVVRRLEQAGATFELGLFLTECGRYPEAVKVFERAVREPEWVERGVAQRAMGDALMYQDSFFAAERAYATALNQMPNDGLTLTRRRMARLGVRGVDDRVFFPRSNPVETLGLPGPARSCHVHGHTVFLAGETWLAAWHPEHQWLWSTEVSNGPRRLTCDGALLYSLDQVPARAWRLDTGELAWELPDERLLCMAGDRLVVAGAASRLLNRDGYTISAWGQPLTCAGLTPDGGQVVGGTADGELGIVAAETGDLLHKFAADHGVIRQVVLFADRPVVIAVGATVRMWDLAKVQPLVDFSVHGQPLTAHLSPSEHFLMVEHEGGLKELFDLAGHLLFSLQGPACFTPHDHLLYESEGRLTLWSLTRRHRLRQWEPHGQKLQAIAAGSTVVTASDRLCLWEYDEENRVYQRELLITRGRSLAEEELTRTSFEEFYGRACQHLEADSAGLAYRDLMRARGVRGYARDRRVLDMLLELCDFLPREKLSELWERQSLECPGAEQVCADFVNETVFVRHQGQVSLFSISNGRRLNTLAVNDASAIAYATGRLIVGTRSGQLLIVDPRSLQLDQRLPLEGAVLSVYPDQRGLFAVASTEAGHVHLVDLENLTSLRDFEAGQLMAASPDLAYGITGPSFAFWALPKAHKNLDARALKEPPGREVTAAALDGEGEFAVTAGADHQLRLWQTRSGRCCLSLEGHNDRVVFVHVWPKLLAAVSAAADGRMIVWDLATGQAFSQFTPHRGAVVSGWAGPFGRNLVTAGADGSVRVWELSWDLQLEGELRSLSQVFDGKSTLGRLGSFFGLR